MGSGDVRGRGAGFRLNLSRISRMKSKLYVGDPLRVGSGPEDFALVVFQRFDPAGDIAGMVRDVGRDAEFRCDEGRRQLGTQFLHRIGGGTQNAFACRG